MIKQNILLHKIIDNLQKRCKEYILKMKIKKVYILGGSGLIGSSVVKNFIKRGYKVLNIDIVDKKFAFKNKQKNYFYKNLDLSNLNILRKGI